LNTKHLATEALAKRDVAGRLRTLATGLSLTSDKTWLMRRATHLEQDAARLERQASKAAGQTGDPIWDVACWLLRTHTAALILHGVGVPSTAASALVICCRRRMSALNLEADIDPLLGDVGSW